MSAVTQRVSGRFSARRVLAWSMIALAVIAARAQDQKDAPADRKDEPQPQQQQTGRLIRVPLPITGDVDTQVKNAVQRALTDMKGAASRPVLIFELAAPTNKSGDGSDFGRALALAKYISGRDLAGAKTVAFIPRAVKGHAVLVAMACEEIVMAADAQIGDAGMDEPAEQAIDPTMRTGYRQIAERRKTIPAAVALGMLDRQLEVYKVETEVSQEFVLGTELDALRKTRVASETLLKPAGELGHFSGRQARELGFAKYLAADRPAVAKALPVPVKELEEDPSQGGEWHPLRVVVRGPIKASLASRVERMIRDQLAESNVNFICLWIDSPGGSIQDTISLANYLATLDPSQYRTAAYIDNQARGDAALLAVACDQIFMLPGAVLGGSGAAVISEEDIELLKGTLRGHIAPSRSRAWSLPEALVDPKLTVYRFTHRQTGLEEYFSDEELAAQPDADDWMRGDEVTQPGLALRLNGREAEKLGLVRQVVSDFEDFKQKNGLTHEIALIEPGWAHFLIDALAAPGVAWMLLFIGGAALYAELHVPGIGLAGFVAAICFLLFFWSRYLDGTAGWLEALLFVAGVACVLLEIFVLPGATIFGLGGGLMIISSLILASQTFVFPHNDYQVDKLSDTLLGLAGTGLAILVTALVMRRFLPRAPGLSHMVLEPPSGEELENLSHRESLVDFNHLLGRSGVTTTQLTPSGKARFGHELVDVIADGEVIDRGTQVTVVEVRGNRVVVASAGNGLPPAV